MKCWRRILIALLAAALLVSATAPAMADSVKAKVTSSSAKIYRKASSKSSCVKLKKLTGMAGVTKFGASAFQGCKILPKLVLPAKVTVTAVKGGWAKVKISGKTGYVPVKYLGKASSGSSSSSWKSKVVKLNWFDGGSGVLGTGSYGTIYDIDTGLTVRIKRMGGHNHADVEPATAADTAKLKKIAGGSFSWDCIPVILRAGGKYVACSINTMPHGDQTITDNDYDGQFCLHMVGSKTHGTESSNENHQAAIEKAYKWAH